MTKISDPDNPWRYRCPECGSTTIKPKSDNAFGGSLREYPEQYYCQVCTHHFDEPRDMKADSESEVMADGCGHVLIRPSSTRSDYVYHQPHADQPDRPRCKVNRGGTEAREYRRRQPEMLDDRYRLCSYCDPEWSVERETDDMAPYQKLAEADSLDDLRADGGQVTVDADTFDAVVDELRGIADDLHGSGLEMSADAIAERLHDLEVAASQEVADGHE